MRIRVCLWIVRRDIAYISGGPSSLSRRLRATIDQESATTAKLFAAERVIEAAFAVNGLGYSDIPNSCEWNVLDLI